uniref:HTH CENPB-type domain-containing protein n=1 Tax=Takifugu rubripes TaxID=31033 RepID=A0A674N661_TAKRU
MDLPYWPEYKTVFFIGQVNRQLRRSYDANFKILVINEAESSNNCKAAVKYAQKDGLKNAHSQRKAFRGPQSGRFQELDRRVCAYVDEKRKDGMPISRAVIQLKVVEIAKELNIPTAEFRASLDWWKRMMRRNGLTLRRRTSLAQPLCDQLKEKHSYPLDQVGNADQTPVFFDMPTPVTVHKKGEKSVIIKSTGNEKSRVTVMLACLADGTKLPPYVVLKRKTVPKEAMPAGIIVRAQEKGWMETELVVDWLKVVWGRRRGGLRKKSNMLILDAFCGHLSHPVKKQVKAMNGDLVIIPGGMTSQLQVLDVVVNKPFKDNLPKKYTEWLLSGDHALTPTGKIQILTLRLNKLKNWINLYAFSLYSLVKYEGFEIKTEDASIQI